MTSQIFKSKISNEYFINFIKNNFSKIKNYYLINKSGYKSLIYYNNLEEFIENISSHYHNSKLYYVNRDINYKNFLTIIRQICKNLNITYISKILYNNSDYEIVYYIY